MIYLDNAATTFPSDAALAAFDAEARAGANPSSMHAAGFDAHRRLEGYRAVLAETLSASPEEVYFTSGGTESANLAVFGAVRALGRRGKTILVSDAEHPCVSECMRALKDEGFRVVEISTRGGELDLDAIRAENTGDVILAAFMHTNNETGAVFPVKEAFDLVKAKNPNAVTFCDCVQAYGKAPLRPKTLGADLLSISAHKIRALRGAGALYVRKGVRLVPVTRGGGQEAGLRSGTENAPSIAAFAAAAAEAYRDLNARTEKMHALRRRLADGLAALDGVEVLTVPKCACHLVSASFAGYKSEVLLHLFSDRGIMVSAGSACSSKKKAKSPVLLAHGLSPALADSTLRFSLSDTTTNDDIDAALSAARDILKQGGR